MPFGQVTAGMSVMVITQMWTSRLMAAAWKSEISHISGRTTNLSMTSAVQIFASLTLEAFNWLVKTTVQHLPSACDRSFSLSHKRNRPDLNCGVPQWKANMSPSARAESHLLKQRRHRLTWLQAQDFMWSSETVAYFEGLFILQLQIKTFQKLNL